MELLQIHYFYDSAMYGSFTKTAQKYMVPVASVSSSVRRLEAELNCQLFDRFPNSIVLNENGQKLLNLLAPAIEKIDSVPILFAEASQDNRTINILIRAMTNEVSLFLAEYKKLHPEAKMKITYNQQSEDYHNYHLVIDEKSNLYSDYNQFDMADTELIFLVAKEHTILKENRSLSFLNHEDVLLPAKGGAAHRAAKQFFVRQGVVPNIVCCYDDMSIYRESIMAGMGIGIGRRNSAGHLVTDTEDFGIIPKPWYISQIVSIYYNPQELYGNVKSLFDFIAYKDFFHAQDVPYVALS